MSEPSTHAITQKAIETAAELHESDSIAAETFQRRSEFAEGLVSSLEKASTTPASEARQQRIAAKIYEHTLRDAGKNEEAEAVKQWINAGRVRDTVEHELTQPPESRPFLSRIQNGSPDILPHLVEKEACNHGDTPCSHNHVHGKSCSHGVPKIHTPKGNGNVEKEACNHGDTPCSHNHVHGESCSHGMPEIHAPKGNGNVAFWGAVAVGAVCVGAYLINEYGKEPASKTPSKRLASWKEHIQQPTAEARSL